MAMQHLSAIIPAERFPQCMVTLSNTAVTKRGVTWRLYGTGPLSQGENMKLHQLAAVIAMFSSCAAIAQTPPPGQGQRPPGGQNGQGQNFAEHKQEALQHMEARLQVMQTAISCVQAASNHEAMRTCHEQERQQMERLRPRS